MRKARITPEESRKRRRQSRPPQFGDLATSLEQIRSHSFHLWLLAGDAQRLKGSIPDAEAVETVRRMVTQNVAAVVKGLLYHLDVLNGKFKPVPPLTETEEQWLRRQLEGLTDRHEPESPGDVSTLGDVSKGNVIDLTEALKRRVPRRALGKTEITIERER